MYYLCVHIHQQKFYGYDVCVQNECFLSITVILCESKGWNKSCFYVYTYILSSPKWYRTFMHWSRLTSPKWYIYHLSQSSMGHWSKLSPTHPALACPTMPNLTRPHTTHTTRPRSTKFAGVHFPALKIQVVLWTNLWEQHNLWTMWKNICNWPQRPLLVNITLLHELPAMSCVFKES